MTNKKAFFTDDSVLSIATAGASVGENGIPEACLAGILDWPINVARLRETATRLNRLLETGESTCGLRCFWPGMILRNLLFLAVVLCHGFRRLVPPY